MKGKLSEVFENEAIFDKFSVSASPDGNTVATGSYSNCFHLVDQDGCNTQFELNYKKATISKNISGKQPPLGKVDYLKKTTALDYHPLKNSVAVASLNCFFLYNM
jgi:serine/threonine-protein phosphatase 2A regulatory subunit B